MRQCVPYFQFYLVLELFFFLDRLQAKGGPDNPIEIHCRRMLWLILFRLLNTFLLVYPYDILIWYGIAGLLLFTFRNMHWKKLLFVMGCFMLIQTFGFRYASVSGAQADQAAYNQAIVLEASGKELNSKQEKAKAKWTKKLKSWNGDGTKRQKESDLNLKGNPIQLWKNLAGEYIKYVASTGFWRFLNDVIIAVLLGMALFLAGLMTSQPSAKLALEYP